MTAEDLQTLIDLFIEHHPEYAIPSTADGNCGLAFDEFCDLSDNFGFAETAIQEIHFTAHEGLLRSGVTDTFHYCDALIFGIMAAAVGWGTAWQKINEAMPPSKETT